MRVKSFFYKFALLASLGILFFNIIPSSKANASSNTFTWLSETSISGIIDGEKQTFNLSEEQTGVAPYSYNSTSYYFFRSNKEKTENVRGVTVTGNDYVCISKRSPLSGFYASYAPTLTSASGTAIKIADPEGVAPEPLKIISKGIITGKIIMPDGYSEDNINVILNSFKLYLTTESGTPINFNNSDGGTSLAGNQIRKIYKSSDGKYYYYSQFSLDLIQNDNDGLYEGTYIINGEHSEHSDCNNPGEMKGGGTDQLACTTTVTISTKVKLKYLPDGSGEITVVDGTDAEKNSPGNGLATTQISIDKGINLEIKSVSTSPLDQAISNAIKWILKGIQSTMNWVMGTIDGLLENTADMVIGKAGAEVSSAPMYSPWISIRNVGISLLVMVLIIIAFANTLQIDVEQYGVGRMIPKIIISIIMAYASWIIVEFFFDFSAAIQSQAMGLANNTNMLTTLQTFKVGTPDTGQIIANLGILILIIIILIGLVACGIVLLFCLLIRIIVLSALLVVAPLAFVFNILPFTAGLYKQWWSEFFKWMFMGPLALAIIAIGGLIASTSGFNGSTTMDLTSADAINTIGQTGRPGALVGLVIFAASLYIAATLPMKWGGGIMKTWSSVGKKMSSPITNTAKKAGKAAGTGLWNNTGGRIAQPIGSAIKQWRGDKNDERLQKNEASANKMLFNATGGNSGMSPEVFARNQESATLNEIAKKHQYLDRDSFQEAYDNAKSPLSQKAILLAGTRAGLLNEKMKGQLIEKVGSDSTGLLEAAAQKDYLSELMGSSNDEVASRAMWSVAKNPLTAKTGDLEKIPAMLEKYYGSQSEEVSGIVSKTAGKLSGLSEQQYKEMGKTKSAEELEKIKHIQERIQPIQSRMQSKSEYGENTIEVQKEADLANELLGSSRRTGDIQAASDLAEEELKKNR